MTYSIYSWNYRPDIYEDTRTQTDEDDFIEVIPVDGDPYYWECIWCGEACFGYEPWNTTHQYCSEMSGC